MRFKSIGDIPDKIPGIPGVGWQRAGTRVVYLHDGSGRWTANIAHTVDGFIVAIRHRQGFERQPKVYENLGEAMLIAEALVALAD